MSAPNRKAAPKRNPLEDTISASIPKRLKKSLMGRAQLLERPTSQILRHALEYLDSVGWTHVPIAVLPAKQEQQLKRWLDATMELDAKTALEQL